MMVEKHKLGCVYPIKPCSCNKANTQALAMLRLLERWMKVLAKARYIRMHNFDWVQKQDLIELSNKTKAFLEEAKDADMSFNGYKEAHKFEDAMSLLLGMYPPDEREHALQWLNLCRTLSTGLKPIEAMARKALGDADVQ